MEPPRPRKACSVVIRRHPDGRRDLLAFEHPRAGKQWVKGSVEPGETDIAAALRELREESGLVAISARSLVTFPIDSPSAIWAAVLCEVEAPPESWVFHCADDGGHAFRFFWHPLDEGLDDEWAPPFRHAFEHIRGALTGPVEVRAATLSDVPAIRSVYAREVLEGVASFELEAPSELDMAGRLSTVQSHGLPYLVAVSGEALAGFAYATPYRPRGAYQGTVEESVYVAVEHQRRGVGRALLSALIQACADRGRRQMVGVITDPGRNGSAALHAALSFREVGVLRGVGEKFGETLDTLIVQRALSGKDFSRESSSCDSPRSRGSKGDGGEEI